MGFSMYLDLSIWFQSMQWINHLFTFQWLKELRLYCPNAPIVLVGTQMDLRDCEVTKEKLIKRKLVPVSTEDGERVRKEMNAFKYFECSAKTQVCIKLV